eukprot:INCI16764.2.p1 GENE.INCI16764.2~~INCI16764.2.p1  ORF type:complete len:238 (+),score=33.11 INCI16764.2:460-1173(+)
MNDERPRTSAQEERVFARQERDNARTDRDTAKKERDSAKQERDAVKHAFLQCTDPVVKNLLRQEWGSAQLEVDHSQIALNDAQTALRNAQTALDAQTKSFTRLAVVAANSSPSGVSGKSGTTAKSTCEAVATSADKEHADRPSPVTAAAGRPAYHPPKRHRLKYFRTEEGTRWRLGNFCVHLWQELSYTGSCVLCGNRTSSGCHGCSQGANIFLCRKRRNGHDSCCFTRFHTKQKLP